MMLPDVCLSDVWRLSDVCRLHPVGGRRVRPAGWMAPIGWSGPAWPAWLKAAPADYRCRPGRGYIVAAARLQLVYFAHALNWMREGQRVQVTRSHRSLVANRHCTRRRYSTSRRYRAYPVPCFIWFQLPRAAKLNYFNRPPAKNHETVHEEASTCLFYVSKTTPVTDNIYMIKTMLTPYLMLRMWMLSDCLSRYWYHLLATTPKNY